jgi:hypothetical protein
LGANPFLIFAFIDTPFALEHQELILASRALVAEHLAANLAITNSNGDFGLTK